MTLNLTTTDIFNYIVNDIVYAGLISVSLYVLWAIIKRAF